LGVVIGMPRFVFPQIIPEFLVFRQSLVLQLNEYGFEKAPTNQVDTKQYFSQRVQAGFLILWLRVFQWYFTGVKKA
ncbi:hypothetical protein ACXO8W_09890, partial [Lactobacillus delbrueckii subsp. bulgaricus]